MEILLLTPFLAYWIEAKMKAKEEEINKHTKSVMKQIKSLNKTSYKF